MAFNNGILQPTNSPAAFSSQNGGTWILDGSEDYISTSTQYTYTQVSSFTVGLWIKTSDTRGRKLIGFENTQTSSSSSYDRQVYLGTDGKLYFGVYNYSQFIRSITSIDTYNDNYWYYVVGTYGSQQLNLYANGILIATGTAIEAEPYNGYWRAGGGALAWTNGNAGTITGRMGPVHAYDRALSISEVLDNFNFAKSRFYTNNNPTVAASLVSGSASLTISATTDGGASVSSYAIQRATSTTGLWTTLTSNAVSSSYTDSTIVSGNTYYYRAKFIQNDNKNSDWGSVSSGVTKP